MSSSALVHWFAETLVSQGGEAEGGAAPAQAQQQQPQQQPQPPAVSDGLTSMLPLLAVIVVLFYFMLIRPQKRDQAIRQAMLDGMKKNDRVLTTGGIYGVVVNVNTAADEVTLRVDENSPTRLRVTRSSILRVLGGDAAESTETKENK